MKFWRKYHDILWHRSRCLLRFSAEFFELDRGEGVFEALTRVKAGEQACDLVTAYLGDIFNALCAEAQPEIAEVTKLHDVAL